MNARFSGSFISLHGRADSEKYHSRLLRGRFKEAVLTLLQQEVRFLQPDTAVVHWSWKIDGDKDYDGMPRHIALRDIGLCLGAFGLAKLTESRVVMAAGKQKYELPLAA